MCSSLEGRRVVEKADTIGHGHGHGHFQKALLHLYNGYFSYLKLFLQQSLLPEPGIDLVIVLIHL